MIGPSNQVQNSASVMVINIDRHRASRVQFKAMTRMETPNAENIKNKFIFTMNDARVVISIHITEQT